MGQTASQANKHWQTESSNLRFLCCPTQLTPFCNVLDAVVIKVLKVYMRELYGEWVEGDEYTFTAAGNYRKPPYRTICEWVVKATARMNTPENRRKWAAGFPVCGWNYVSKSCDPLVLGTPFRSYHGRLCHPSIR